MTMKYLGSCLCQAVKYQIKGKFEKFYLCHCRYCQKDKGSAHAANLFSTTANLQWIKGESNVRIFRLKNSRHIKAFCVTCGSALPYLQTDGHLLVVPAGSLDGPLENFPDGHIFISKKANWDESLQHVTRFERFPTET